MPDNYVSAKVAFLHPLNIKFRKNPNIQKRRLLREYTTTFVLFFSVGEMHFLQKSI